MDFSIYSVGDAAFLEQIMIAVAMATGTGDFERMVSIGLLIGALIISFQSLFQGAKSWDLHQVFACWLVYAISFGAGVTVTIEDAYNGQVRVVDNVPVGPAAAGSIISSVGFGLTKLFEVAYSPVASVTESKFMDSLELLSKLRNHEMESALWTVWNDSLGGGTVDMKKSLTNYISECTAIKFSLGESNEDQINTENWRTALRFDSQIYGTRLFLSPSGPTDPSCTDGWIQLSQSFETAFNSGLSQQALGYLLSTTDALNATSDALYRLQVTNVAAGDFIKANFLQPIVQRGFAQYYSDMNDPYAQIMLTQAESQRNTQYAAEQSLFVKSIQPLMTLVEGFAYAITPIAAFVMVLGSKGLLLVGKYLQMLIWVQLWLPIMSVINLFIYIMGQQALAKYTTGNLSSFEGVAYAGAEIERWIGIGGMMAAATPVLSLMLVTGSVYAFNSLAQRVGASDTVNEKLMSPDLVDRGSVLSQQPQFNQSRIAGTMTSGGESLVDSINLGSTVSNALSSSSAATAQAQKGFASQLSNSVFSGHGSEQTYSQLHSLGKTLRASDSTQAKSILSAAQNYVTDRGINASHTDAVAGAIAMRASAGVDAGKLAAAFTGPVGAAVNAANPVSMNGSLDVSAQSQSQDSRQQLSSDIDSLSRGLGFTKDDSSALTSDLARQVSTDKGQRFTQSLGEEQRKQLMQSSSDLLSSQQTYQELSQAQQTIGTTSNNNISALADKVLNNWSAGKSLSDGVRQSSPETRDFAQRKAQHYQDLGIDSQRAIVGGQLFAMLNSNSPSEQAIAASAIAKATGGNSGIDFNQPGQSAMLVKDAPRYVSPVENSSALSAPERMGNQQKLLAESGSIGSENSVRDAHEKGIQQLEQSYGTSRNEYLNDRLPALRAQIMASDLAPSTSSALFAGAEGAGRFVQQVVGGAGAAKEGFAESFGQSMSKLAQMTPEQRDQFIEDTKKGDDYVKQEYGLGGFLAVGAANLGRDIIGVGISGFEAGKEWLTGKSDLSEAAQGMSVRERGMFFASALASASEAGAGKAAEFVQQYGDEFRQIAMDTARYDYGLNSQAGAELFAASLMGGDSSRSGELRENLREEVGDNALADKMAAIIESSAGAGKDQAGGYLAPVSRYLSVAKGGR